MAGRVLLYGVGYTGRLVLHELQARGCEPVVAGRNPAVVETVAAAAQCEARTCTIEDLPGALGDIDIVCNAAGPFAESALRIATACVEARVDYIDISGETDAQLALQENLHGPAREAGVMLLPGAGFECVASDCLAAHVAARVPGGQELHVGIAGQRLVSRGSLRTLLQWAGRPIWVRRESELVPTEPGQVRYELDYGSGLQSSLAVSWPDLVTAFLTTGIPNITVYFEATPAVELMLSLSATWTSGDTLSRVAAPWIDLLPEGPSEGERRARRCVIAVQVLDADGRGATARLETPESYTATGALAAAAVAHTLRVGGEPGFQTPGVFLGADFPLQVPGVVRHDDPAPKAES